MKFLPFLPQKIKEEEVQDKDWFVEGIILIVYIIFVALFIVVVIAASYGLLYSLNYISISYPETFSFIEKPNEKVEIYHLLLTSILLSLCVLAVFKFNENYGNLIQGFYKSMATDLSVVSEQLDKIDENTKNLDEILEHINTLESSISFEVTNIKDSLEKIEENTSDIKELKDGVTSLEFTVSNLRD